MKKYFFIAITYLFLSSCSSEISSEQVEGCWTVAYIDTDGVRDKSGSYEMCFESNGTLITQRKNGEEKVKAEWELEDSTIITHYAGNSKPDTMKIIKIEDEKMDLELKKRYSTITIYLRKKK